MWSKEDRPNSLRPLRPPRLICHAENFKRARPKRLKTSRKIVRSMLPLSMSYEHCHENAQEEAAKMLVTCSHATEFKWSARPGGHSCLPRGGSRPPKGLCAVAKPRTPQMANAAISSSAKIPRPPWRLIANLELKLQLTYRKLSLLRISNRKKTTFCARLGVSPTLCLHFFPAVGARHAAPGKRPWRALAIATVSVAQALLPVRRCPSRGRNGWQTLPHRYPLKFEPSIVMPFLIETPRLEFPVTAIIAVSSKFLIETK